MTNQEKFIQIFGVDVWQQMIVFSGLAEQFKEYWTSPYKYKAESAVNDIGLTEIYVNLKNHDLDTCGNYKMDRKEAEKFVRVYKEIKGIE
jgi:hypothetical protein